MDGARAIRRIGAAWGCLAVLLLGLTACGSTIPNTGVQTAEVPEALRLAPIENKLVGEAQFNTAAENPFCPILRYPRLNDLSVYAIADLAEPPPRSPFYDPVFGSCLARLTDRTEDRSPVDNSTGLHAPGPGVQAFNADSSRVLIRSNAGFWYVYNSESLRPVLRLPVEDAQEVFWDAVDPFLLYYLRGMRLIRYSLVNGQEELIHNFALDFGSLPVDRVSMLGGSSMTEDGQTWGLAGIDENGSALVLVVYDLTAGKITAHLHLPKPLLLNSVRISPDGGFLLVGYDNACSELQPNGAITFCGLSAYNGSLIQGRLILPTSGAFDTAFDSNGREVVVYYDPGMSSISMFDLQNEEHRALLLIDSRPAVMNLEISGRAFARPGWALVSVYGFPDGAGSWLDSAVVAFELKTDGLIARLAQNHSVYAAPEESQWVHPGASPNQDFTRIIFTSNWGSASGEVDAYIIALPEDWTSPVQENTVR